MACYAPLLAREGFTQWRPDLIWFDSTRAYGTPSYHVQKLFGRNRPDEVLPVRITQPMTHRDSHPGMIGVGTWNTAAEFKDVRVTRHHVGDGRKRPVDVAKRANPHRRPYQARNSPPDG